MLTGLQFDLWLDMSDWKIVRQYTGRNVDASARLAGTYSAEH